MGRPRKQPRRIVTFNLNADLAQRIDDLNLSNRSEWANGVFREVMDDRLAQRQGQVEKELDAREELGREEALSDLRDNPKRLAAMLLAALQSQGMDGLKVKGRYTLSEQLFIAVNDDLFATYQRPQRYSQMLGRMVDL